MLTSDHIDMLLTVIDKGSFSAAARALGRTPSAISMAIANLEAELDLVLFDRGTREPTPTAAMAALLPDARAIAERLHALRAHAQHLSEGVEDTLRLGLAAEVDGAPVARALAAVSATYPALAVSIVTAPQDAIVDALHRGAVDLCVAYGGVDLHPQEQIHALWTETLVAVATPTHPLIAEAAHPEAIEQLSGFRQIVIADPDRPLTDVRPVIGNRTWKVTDMATAIALVKAGHGWANLPESAIGAHVAARELVPLRFANIRNGLPLPVYLRRPKHTGLGKAAGELLRALQGTADRP
ncbi:LysR family transcriptional regulator [Burkholderia multivorans]|uniref:LysR family transcriptional regulator n=1 Tax=Burkholderia multivorans TaxID=87883 RepID=UPI000277CA67|nr:LysR family transcriptional regulator [Burkholderia multivorans]AJY15871.1 bacterial regulatory helix-turn-helix, lysR family protein [Burkholderia multivorans ATCC BAA-247]AVR18429.1 LysR family transcriptional regulator [Burkholderia multivorans]EJO55085.1 LysR substrate binding domain protein [Burkholderia multivorans ATCC BAA-247]MBU9334230.1 LysR family transcriptional regulator [Burkholderia multivorans]MBU9496753.1 LysR family transcriptional regulator [Burkholderia multivorans]